MEDQINTIISEVRKETTLLADDRKPLVDQYLIIVESTVVNQGKIMESYENLVKKLENQVVTCQTALDESTRREIEQLQMIMELKLQIEQRKQVRAAASASKGDSSEKPKAEGKTCDTCEAYEMEASLLKEQTEKQQEVIDKLSEAQEMLLLQYKVMEMGLAQEIGNVAKAQEELEKIKNEHYQSDEEEAVAEGGEQPAAE